MLTLSDLYHAEGVPAGTQRNLKILVFLGTGYQSKIPKNMRDGLTFQVHRMQKFRSFDSRKKILSKIKRLD